MISKKLMLFVFAVLAVTACQVRASIVLFDNGSFTPATPQAQRNYIDPFHTMFEDFVLGANATLNEVRWGGGEYHSLGTSDITSVNLTIYDGVPGTGTVILSTSVTPSASFVGNFSGFDRYDYTISGLSLALNAGTTYWFGLSTISTFGANWSNTFGTTSTIAGLYQSVGPLPGNFFADEDGAFQLHGELGGPLVPEPGTIMIWTVFAGTGLVINSRHRKVA